MNSVQSPGLLACCRAVAGLPVGMVKPRKLDRKLLSGLASRGLPAGDITVELIALPQVARDVPTVAVAEGVWRPRTSKSAMTAFVVRHPEATFVVDPGMCVDVKRRAIADLPRIYRGVVDPPSDVIDIVQSLDLAGIGVGDIDFALPTHLHWDHVAGLLDLPELTVKVHRYEFDWATTGAVAPVGGVRAALSGRPTDLFDLDGPPLLTFARSHDLFCDGSVVLVDLAGHTPGSAGVLLRTRTGSVLLAGDAIWDGTQLERGRQKASFPGRLIDVDEEQTWRTLHRLIGAREHAHVVATHDHRATQTFAVRPVG